MLSFKRLARSRLVQRIVGTLAAEYLRLVWMTNKLTIEPADVYEHWGDSVFIFAMWHGQHFMAPFARRENHRVKALISRHHDGEINAIAAERLNIGTIRGSGDHGGRFDRKGGVHAFKTMVEALAEGYVVALTADVPKVARVVGKGVVKLAQISGRPIIPVAVATSRRIQLNNWDRSVVNLPFGHLAMVAGDPIYVPSGADETQLELCRQAVETGLNATTKRAYDIVDSGKGGRTRA
jgi:lysophospholipid acyltransferase (LPLAT)-like uncharacterized protein